MDLIEIIVTIIVILLTIGILIVTELIEYYNKQILPMSRSTISEDIFYPKWYIQETEKYKRKVEKCERIVVFLTLLWFASIIIVICFPVR